MSERDDQPGFVTRIVRSGAIKGVRERGICRFLGIPYAEPPVGENRFREAQERRPWEGELDCTRPGPSAPYEIPEFPGIDIVPLVGPGGTRENDYLRLNVWAPESAANCPVMVWIHGGAFVIGTKDAASTDGSAFAKSGIICVAINYRLGIDGFLPIPGAPTNLGLRDMLFAIRWVRENITVFGESAGAMALADLVTSPLVKGLFKRAVIESGHGGMVRDIAVAQRLVRKLAKILRVSPDADGFRSVDFDSGWAAIQRIAKPFTRLDLRDAEGHEPVFGISRFVPVYGDDVLPKKPLESLKDGAGKDIEVLIGTNAEEMNFYFVPSRVKFKLRAFLAKWLLRKWNPHSKQVLKAYGLGQPGKGPGEVFTDAENDLVFRWPARRFAEEHRGRTHFYEFDWRSPRFAGELGASHGMELGFVFKTLPSMTGPTGLVGDDPPFDFADRVHQIWVDFARDGSVPWPEFDRVHRNVRRLFADTTIQEPVMPAAPFLP